MKDLFTLRRSTRPNIKSLIKDEIVKKFENVVLDEINKNDNAIKHYKKEYEIIYDLFEEHKKELIALKKINEKSYEHLQEKFIEEVNRIEHSFEEQRKQIRTGLKKIDMMIEDIDGRMNGLISLDQYEENQRQISDRILQVEAEHQKCLETTMQQMHEVETTIRTNVKTYETHNSNKLSEFENMVNEFQQMLKTNIVDANGISRMIKVDQKSMFVMEKKIEHLYTLIDRMKKGD